MNPSFLFVCESLFNNSSSSISRLEFEGNSKIVQFTTSTPSKCEKRRTTNKVFLVPYFLYLWVLYGFIFHMTLFHKPAPRFKMKYFATLKYPLV